MVNYAHSARVFLSDFDQAAHDVRSFCVIVLVLYGKICTQRIYYAQARVRLANSLGDDVDSVADSFRRLAALTKYGQFPHFPRRIETA